VVGLAALVLFVSLPLGYGLHQLLVNVHRSERRIRPAHKLVFDSLIAIEQQSATPPVSGKEIVRTMDQRGRASLLTAVLDVLIYACGAGVTVDPSIHERIESRWSHFYARRAVGRISPLAAIVVFALAVSAMIVEGDTLVLTPISISTLALYWVSLTALLAHFVDRYSQKLWDEICYLEFAIASANSSAMLPTLRAIVDSYTKSPDLIRNLDSYGLEFSVRIGW
jgi:hypothetical protein